MANLPGIAGDDFTVGYRVQTAWGVSMGTAFFCGELGAGLFVVSLLMDYMPGMVLGLILTGVGKPYFHLSHMGQPAKSWRAIVMLNKSWVSRGFLAIILFIGFGLIYMLDKAYGLLPALGLGAGAAELAANTAAVLAILSALVVMLYQGLTMSHSSAITLWSTGVMPIMGLLYALMCGVSLVMALGFGSIFAADREALLLLERVDLGLLLGVFLTLLSLLHAARYGSTGGRQSVRLLFSPPLNVWFVGGVLMVGILIPALLMLFGPANFLTVALLAAAQIAGYYAFRILILKTGVYEPIMDLAAQMFRR